MSAAAHPVKKQTSTTPDRAKPSSMTSSSTSSAAAKAAKPHRSLPTSPPASKPEASSRFNTLDWRLFASSRSPRRQYFIIHPDWKSENVVPPTWNVPPATWTNTYPPPHTGRRCRSAPPPGMRSRNPITWENSDVG